MAEAVDIQKLRSFLTCSICLDNFHNPKRLTCSHLFCKCCLEDLVEFSPDGTALIQCPLRCKVQTFLDDNETLDDLPPSYEIKGILEALELNKRSPTPQSALCSYHHDCRGEVSVYCCGNLLCSSCAGEHEKCWREHDKRKSLIFDKREGKLFVLCDEHASKCTHICEQDDTFLCMYCIMRYHKDHEMDPAENTSRVVRKALLKNSKNIDMARMLVNKTEENICNSRKKLGDLLRERKLEKLLSYIDRLNKEEQKIRKTFECIADDHLKQYPDDSQGEYYYKKLLKDDILFSIEKEKIMRMVADFNLDNFSVNPLTVWLPDPCHPYPSDNILGELRVNVGKEISIGDLNSTSATFKDTIKPSLRLDIMSTKILEEVKKIVGFESMVARSKEQNVTRSRISNEERVYVDIHKNLISSLKKRGEAMRKFGKDFEGDNNNVITHPTLNSETTGSSSGITSPDYEENNYLLKSSTLQRRDDVQLRRSSYKSPLFPIHPHKERSIPPRNYLLPSRFDTSRYCTSPIERNRDDIVGGPTPLENQSNQRSSYQTDLSTRSTQHEYPPEAWEHRSSSNTHHQPTESISQDLEATKLSFTSNIHSNETNGTEARSYSYRSIPHSVEDQINSSDEEEDEELHIRSRPHRSGKSVPFCPTAIEDLKVGMKVSVNRSRPMLSRGTVKWTGTLPGHTGDYVGIELDVENGKHDGLFDGERYFRCRAERGIFVRLSKVIMAWK